jgi:hypothetical protein
MGSTRFTFTGFIGIIFIGESFFEIEEIFLWVPQHFGALFMQLVSFHFLELFHSSTDACRVSATKKWN